MVTLGDVPTAVRCQSGKGAGEGTAPYVAGSPAALASLALTWALVFAAATPSAGALPEAMFNATFQCPVTPGTDEYADGLVLRSSAGQLDIDYRFGGFGAHGSLTTSGGELPRASFSMQTAGSGEEGQWLSVRALAGVLYYFRVVPAPGTVWSGAVPVHVTAAGHMSASANPATNIGRSHVSVTIYRGTTWSVGVDMTGETGDESFAVDTTLSLSHSRQYYVSISAVGELSAFTGQTTTISAWVDPTLEIDPTWARNHPDVHFTIEYSPGFGPVAPASRTVSFLAGAHGTISGSTPQTVLLGGDTAPVTAVAAYGYLFDQWSDGSTGNPRTVSSVTADLTLTASFRAANPVAPNGRFTAAVDASAAPGRRLWDLSGAYATSVKGNPLSLDLVHDARGKLSGTATYTVAKNTAVTMPIRGSVKGSSGNITMKGTLKGADPTQTVSVALTLNLAVNATARQLSGTVNGSVSNGAVTTPVSTIVALPMPAAMDGTWTLLLELVQAAREISGTARLTLSNGVAFDSVVRGKVGPAGVAVLSLAGLPTDPQTRDSDSKVKITPLEGAWARLEAFSCRAYGQTLAW